jgi:hypothetical protein
VSDLDYNQRKMVGEVVNSAFRNITDSIIDTHSAITVLSITVTSELGAFAMFYVSKDKVQEFIAESDDKVWIYGSKAVFVVGFLTAFAAYRLVADKWPHKRAHFLMWLVSIVAGALNVLLFFFLTAFEIR